MRSLLFLAGFVLLAACKTPYEAPSQSTDFSFVVIGDTPYDAEDEKLLKDAAPRIKAGNYPFVIHLGDYKSGGTPCDPKYDTAQLELIRNLAPLPVFYTPGDNETVDCDRQEIGTPPTLPSERGRLDKIRSLFFSGAEPTAFFTERQAGYPENARWTYEDVQFSTFHVVATSNGRSQVQNPIDLEWAKTEIAARDTANFKWLEQMFISAKRNKARAAVLIMHADMTEFYVNKKDPSKSQVPDMPCNNQVSKEFLVCDAFTEFRTAIQEAAKAFGKPVIIIHGDSSPYTFNQAFAGQGAPNLWRLNAAGDVGSRGVNKWGTRDITLVTLHPEQEIPLTAIGPMSGKKPAKK